MKNRIKELRKALKLNQTDFGNKIGLKQGSIAGYESGARTPLDAVVNSICREFNVNENWLRTGEGEMFNEIPQEDEYMRAATEIRLDNDEAAMRAVVSYWKMEPEFKKVFWDKLLEIAEIYKKAKGEE